MLRKLRIGNLIAYIMMIFVNGLANVLPLNGQTTGEVSGKYPVLFTPSPYVFMIWGLIYLLLLGFVIYQLLPSQRNNKCVDIIGGKFIISCTLNSLWIIFWHYEKFLITIIIMLLLFMTLASIYVGINKCRACNEMKNFIFVKLPFSIYFAWICIATIANIAVVLKVYGWSGFGVSPVIWTVLVMLIGLIIAVYIAKKYMDPYILLVFIWAYIGIAVKNNNSLVILVSSIIFAIFLAYNAIKLSVKMDRTI